MVALAHAPFIRSFPRKRESSRESGRESGLATSTDARLLPRRGRPRSSFLALSRRPLRTRDHRRALVRARAVCVSRERNMDFRRRAGKRTPLPLVGGVGGGGREVKRNRRRPRATSRPPSLPSPTGGRNTAGG